MKTFSEKYSKKDLIFVLVMVSLLMWLFWWVKYDLHNTDIVLTTGVVDDVLFIDDPPKTMVLIDDEEISGIGIKGIHSFTVGKKMIIVQRRNGELRFQMEAWW